MANHVPRLGRRSLAPLIPSNEMDSVFLAELVTAELLENPPETEIWLDSSDLYLTVTKTSDITADDKESVPPSAETKASKPEASDQDYWQNDIGEATI